MSTSRPKKKRPGDYHHGDLRRALLDAALREVAERGVNDVSLRALARIVGVSPRAPYRHFPTREDLLAAVAVEGLVEYEARVRAEVEAAGPGIAARLAATGEAYVAFAVERPAYFRVMYPPQAMLAGSAPELVAARARLHAVFLDLITEGQAQKVLREGDPMQIALAWWSMIHGLAVLSSEGQLAGYDRPTNARLLAKLVSRLLHEGLRRQS